MGIEYADAAGDVWVAVGDVYGSVAPPRVCVSDVVTAGSVDPNDVTWSELEPSGVRVRV